MSGQIVIIRVLQETRSVRGERRGEVRKCCVAASHVEILVITHDVDINISFILTLAIAEYNLVDARLVSPGVDDRQVHIVRSDKHVNKYNGQNMVVVSLDGKVDILPDLQLLPILHHNHLQRRLNMSNYLKYC